MKAQKVAIDDDEALHVGREEREVDDAEAQLADLALILGLRVHPDRLHLLALLQAEGGLQGDQSQRAVAEDRGRRARGDVTARVAADEGLRDAGRHYWARMERLLNAKKPRMATETPRSTAK